jgi:hypothetical protein
MHRKKTPAAYDLFGQRNTPNDVVWAITVQYRLLPSSE